MISWKYNYVVFGSQNEYYKKAYSDINNCDGCVYFSEPLLVQGISGYLLRLIRRIHMSPKVNKYIKLPFKHIWNPILYRYKFEPVKPICFIFFAAGPFSEHIPYGFIDYIKERYPDSKCVIFYQDLVEKKRTVSLKKYREFADLIFSFDYGDCEKYNLRYHNLVYSDILNEMDSCPIKSDIYFCGAVKNRLPEILDAYFWFRDHEFICDFHLITKDKKLIKKYKGYEGLNFCKNFSYQANLEHIQETRNMLEIMQKGGTGFTLRTCEAIIFKKRLISNNSFLKKADFYDGNQFLTYNKINEMPMSLSDLLKDFVFPDNTNYISPIVFIDEIDKIV